jgi:hypothetical protein
LESDAVEWVFSRDAVSGSDSVGICMVSNADQQAIAESECWSVTLCEDARGIEGIMYILDRQAAFGGIICGDAIDAAIAELFAAAGLPKNLADAERSARSSYKTYSAYLDASTIPGPPDIQDAVLLRWANMDMFY